MVRDPMTLHSDLFSFLLEKTGKFLVTESYRRGAKLQVKINFHEAFRDYFLILL